MFRRATVDKAGQAGDLSMGAIRVLVVMAGVLVAVSAQAQTNLTSPVGMWRTIDDKTGKERGLVRIFETNGALYGRLQKLYDPAAAGRVCEKCSDDRKGKPLIGLDIVRGLRADSDGGWSGGEILDPESGSTYRASVKLADGGSKLQVRGYLMVSLLGRSQIWVRDR